MAGLLGCSAGKSPRATQAGPTPQWAPGPAHAPPGGLPPPVARLLGPAGCPLGELELGNTTYFADPNFEETKHGGS